MKYGPDPLLHLSEKYALVPPEVTGSTLPWGSGAEDEVDVGGNRRRLGQSRRRFASSASKIGV
jgi:hypothetical protein